MALAYQGLNANNMPIDIVKENGKTGTVGTVVESIVGRAIEDKVIKVKEKLPSGFKVYTTNDFPLWNAYAAAGMLAAIMVNIGAARASQGIPSTILYFNDLLEHETGLPGVDYGRAMGTSVGMSFFSHSIYGGGGPGLFHGNHVVTKHSKGIRHPSDRSRLLLWMLEPRCSLRNHTSPLVKDVFGDIPEFKTPMKVVGKEAKKIKERGGLMNGAATAPERVPLPEILIFPARLLRPRPTEKLLNRIYESHERQAHQPSAAKVFQQC